MVKYLPECECFTVFLKNKKGISNIRRSKVTDYAAFRFLYMEATQSAQSVVP